MAIGIVNGYLFLKKIFIFFINSNINTNKFMFYKLSISFQKMGNYNQKFIYRKKYVY